MKVLFLGAHPDDIEMGCGGTIHKHANDWDILCYTFCHVAINDKYPDLIKCHRKALQILGVKECDNGAFYPSTMPEVRQEVWHKLYCLNEIFKPDLVFTQSPDDHQDHQTVYNETLRVFFKSSVVCYHVGRSEQSFQHNYYEKLTVKDVNAKLEALATYHMYAFDGVWRPSIQACMNKDNIIGQMRANGVYPGVEFAEVFRIVKWVQ